MLPPKVQLFLWLLLQDKVCTHDFFFSSVICFNFSKLDVCSIKEVLKLEAIFSFNVFLLGSYG